MKTECAGLAGSVIATRYMDGGHDVEHGMREGCPLCGCGLGRHYVCPHGTASETVWDRAAHCAECAEDDSSS